MNAIPLILLGGGALLLMGGKKKKTTAVAADQDESEDYSQDEHDADEGDGPQPEEESEEGEGYGTVAKGKRADKRGFHYWRVYYDADGYHAQIMQGGHRMSPVQEEFGVAASLVAAKSLIRDTLNERLVSMYPDESPKNDPEIKAAVLATPSPQQAAILD